MRAARLPGADRRLLRAAGAGRDALLRAPDPDRSRGLWAWLHDPEYEARVARALGLIEYRELVRRESGGELYRRIRMASPLPSSLAPIVSHIVSLDEAGYVEEQWRSRGARVVRWRMTPTILADRVTVEGELRVEPAGPTRCLRILEGEITARIFAVGGLLQRAAIREVIGGYGVAAQVAAAFVRERAKARPG